MLVQSVILIFDSFNTFLQAEEPLIHILYDSTLNLFRLLLLRFILPEVISESDDVLSIEVLFIGAMIKRYTRYIILTSA